MCADFRFSQFPFVATGINIGSKQILNNAELQSETRGVQGFGANSGASAANRLSDSNSLKDIAV